MERSISINELRKYAKEYLENNKEKENITDIVNDFCSFVERQESEHM